MVGGGVRIGDEHRRQAVRGDLEHRAAGARDHEIGRRQRVGEITQGQVLAQVVVERQLTGGELSG